MALLVGDRSVTGNVINRRNLIKLLYFDMECMKGKLNWICITIIFITHTEFIDYWKSGLQVKK